MTGNTLQPIKLNPQELAKLEFDKFVEQMAQTLGCYRETHFEYYEDLRQKNYGTPAGGWHCLARRSTSNRGFRTFR